jgi:hypothetical protein
VIKCRNGNGKRGFPPILSVFNPSGGAQVPRRPVLFNGTNYRDWVPRMRWHMCGLQP